MYAEMGGRKLQPIQEEESQTTKEKMLLQPYLQDSSILLLRISSLAAIASLISSCIFLSGASVSAALPAAIAFTAASSLILFASLIGCVAKEESSDSAPLITGTLIAMLGITFGALSISGIVSPLAATATFTSIVGFGLFFGSLCAGYNSLLYLQFSRGNVFAGYRLAS